MSYQIQNKVVVVMVIVDAEKLTRMNREGVGKRAVLRITGEGVWGCVVKD